MEEGNLFVNETKTKFTHIYLAEKTKELMTKESHFEEERLRDHLSHSVPNCGAIRT